MKRITLFVAIIWGLVGILHSSRSMADIHLIPRPRQVTTLPGAVAAAARHAAVRTIDKSIPAEGYRLRVSPDAIEIQAADDAGFFYADQTLRQLESDGQVACCEIYDYPRFKWRGLMLDVSRHFFTKEEIKRFIDLMAMHKFNRFHWHLVDDQGWRIEIRKHPKLVEVGAWRNEIGFGLDPKSSTTYGPDGRYGGFYTQDDIREVVQYARARHVVVVPEIELPGHATAALNAYPQFSCSGEGHDVNIGAGVHAGVYCAGNDETFAFLQDILSEVIDLFPGEFIHVGGDEVPKRNWKECPKCQDRIKSMGLKNEEELQSYFIKRIDSFIDGKGRRLIGWDEILEGGLAEGAAVMSWRGLTGGIAAANAGHDAVMCPTSHAYFDYLQERVGEPRGIGGFLPLERVYAFEPVPEEIAPDKTTHVLGAQANLWTEYVPNFKHVEYMIYPRAAAMAEVVWSDPEQRDYNDFLQRMQTHVKRLDAMNVNYRPLPPAGLHDSIELVPGNPPTINILPRFGGTKILYTLDGTIPQDDATVYDQPIPVTKKITPVRVRYVHPQKAVSFLTEALILDHGKAIAETWIGTSDEQNPPANAFDGDETTAYATIAAAPKGSAVEVRFLEPRMISRVRVVTGRNENPPQMYSNAVVEATTDGERWTLLATLQDGKANVKFDPIEVKSVRIRLTADHFIWRQLLREFTIE